MGSGGNGTDRDGGSSHCISLVAWCQSWTVKAAGPFFPIKRENLYDGYREIVTAECRSPQGLTQDQWRDCMRNNVLSVDYVLPKPCHNTSLQLWRSSTAENHTGCGWR